MQRSAGAIIYTGGKGPEFLLLRYPGGHWDFAKGKMEPGETERQTAVRETREETGISDLRFVDGFRHVIRYDFEHEGAVIHKQVALFLAETHTRSVALSEEHLDHVWAGYGGALERLTYGNARAALARAADHIPSRDS